MPDISITAANVVKGVGSVVEQGIAGATITQGQAIYKDADAGTWKLADADTLIASQASALALTAASSGQPIVVLTSGPITIGATMTVGETYVVSTTAGGIAPLSDLASGDFTTHIGIATTAAVLQVKFFAGLTAKA